MEHPVKKFIIQHIRIQPSQLNSAEALTRYTFSLTKRGKAIDARLQTAVSVGLVYSIISVHKFDDLIVPRFCWLLFLLHVSCRQSITIKKCLEPDSKIRQKLPKESQVQMQEHLFV